MCSLTALSEQRLAPGCTAVGVTTDGLSLAVACDESIRVFTQHPKTHKFTAFSTSFGREFHSQTISGLDWASDGLLASCSHDAGAVVWEPRGGKWVPNLVVTRLQKAAMCLKWAPAGPIPKFAIGCVDGAVTLCYRDKERSLWAPRILCAPSTTADEHGACGVTGLAWHPSGRYLATVSVDGALRAYSALIPGQDEAPPSTRNACLLEWTPLPGAWTLSVAWSPSGETLAVAAGGGNSVLPDSLFLVSLKDADYSSLQTQAVIDAAQETAVHLPTGVTSMAFLNDDKTLVCAGFGALPCIVAREDNAIGRWHLVDLQTFGGVLRPRNTISQPEKPQTMPAQGKVADRIRKFERGGVDSPSGLRIDRGLTRKDITNGHVSPICGVAALPESVSPAFVTASLDGTLITWQLST